MPIICPQCGTDVEHLLHVFFDCDYATQCWHEVGFHLDMSREEYAPSWLLSKLQTDTQENLVSIAAVLWGIWYARNRRVWDEKEVPPKLAVQGRLKKINEWENAVKRVKEMSQNRNQGSNAASTDRWKRPEEGSLKAHVDASVFPGSNSYTIAIVIRDHTGMFWKGRNARFLGNVSVLEAKAVGMLEVLNWVKDISGVKMTVESDSQLVVNALQKKSANLLEVGHILDECREVLSSRSRLNVVHVKRLANKAAHMMARMPCSLNSHNVYESPPPSVLETIVYDSSCS